MSEPTKEYLGFLNSGDSSVGSDSDSLYSDSDDLVYQTSIERVPRMAPQIAQPDDDELYGEFDPSLTNLGQCDLVSWIK